MSSNQKDTSSQIFMLSIYLLFSFLAQESTADELDAIILRDIIPSSGTKCRSNSKNIPDGVSSYSYIHSTSLSSWDLIASPYERELFLAEMSHEDEKHEENSWTIRIGQGGNIYSFRGFYGEAMPPQYHINGQWIDEVTQSVSVNLAKNNPNNPYFIHQAGVYTKDDQYTDESPFFSPSIAKHCDDKECLFGSWGQQAHLPTIHKSDLLYFNGYRDCGDGVIEFTSVFHNADKDLVNGNPINYLNVPWGGVRYSKLRDIFLSRPDGSMQVQYRLVPWGSEGIINLASTGGFTTFAEQVVIPDDLFNEHPYVMPKKDGETLKLVVAEMNQAKHTLFHSNLYGLYCIRVPIIPTFEEVVGCKEGCLLWLTNSRTKEKIVTSFVIHWSWNGNLLYFCTDEDITATDFNNMFQKNDEVLVSYANVGKPFEDNVALTHVHGTQDASLDQRYATTRVRYGKAGSVRRDYTAYTANARINVNPGDTYIYQQYFITGKLTEVETLASSWKDEVYEELYPLGEMTGTNIHLYSTDMTMFGAYIEGGTECLKGESQCVGKSAPELGYTPLYAISCGSKHYVGSDLYYFSSSRDSEADVIRSYACENEAPHVRPKWKLLGFFAAESCDILINAAYDSSFCTT